LLGSYAALASTLELLAVRVTTGYVPPHAALAVLFIVGEGLVVLTLALLFSTRLSPMTGGIIALVLFGVAWIAGFVQVIGSSFDNSGIVSSTTVVSLLLPSDGLWRGALYNLEPAALIAVSSGARDTPFAVTAAPPTPYIVWAVAWVAVILALSVRRFSRRDL
jgi:ABC-type transport system involved in multi-copper enzyme maturation permease subunit